MSNENADTDDLLEAIPSSLLKPEQVARWGSGRELPTYKLLRKPVNLEELNSCSQAMPIWWDNETLAYVAPRGIYGSPMYGQGQHLFVDYVDKGFKLHIVGKTDEAIAQTAAFFMSLEEDSSTKESSRVFFSSMCSRTIDFSGAGSQCLIHLFERAPSRHVHFLHVSLSSEQSIVLATRPQPVQLTFQSCSFIDEGTAFVTALENRKSSFGSLTIQFLTGGTTGLKNVNMRRLFKVDVISHLSLSSLIKEEELVLLPFSAPVDALDYTIDARLLANADFQPVKIWTKKLSLAIWLGKNRRTPTLARDAESILTTAVNSLLRRVADIGHFLELDFRLFEQYPFVMPDCAVEELFRATLANTNLQVLVLARRFGDLDRDSRMEKLCTVLKEHEGLTTLKINIRDSAFGPHLSHLRDLLSHNRRITVMNEMGDVYTDGSAIDELYSLNRFYRNSARLAVGPTSERSPLVATALMNSTTANFQRSALLLSDHADALHELVQFARLDELDQEGVAPI